jgi:hypothetical protein
MTKNIEEIKYPDFTDITGNVLNKVVPIDKKLFGAPIYWQVKEDGENTGVYLDEHGEMQVRTRNTVKVPEDIRQRFLSLPYAQNIKALLIEVENIHPESDVMLFGEFKVKGKSPKRIEVRDENSFVAFDLWVSEINRTPPFLLWEQVEGFCRDHGVPSVQLVEITKANTLEDLLQVKDRLLAKCRENRWEGVVGKTWVTNEHGMFVNIVKEKIDIPKVKSKPKPGDELPVLPDSEISGAIEKVLLSISQNDFSNAEIAMPMISKLVKEQCVKHKCRSPGSAYNLYRDRLLRLNA